MFPNDPKIHLQVLNGCSDEIPQAFPLIDFDTFIEAPPQTWIIKKILPRAELAVIFGESGSGKTFLTLELALSIARGLDWNGYKTKIGRVVYCCAEDISGFRSRCIAYGKRYLIEKGSLDNFKIIEKLPNFLHDEDPKLLAQSIGHADIIVIDTFARVMPGGREDGEDMGNAIARLQALHKATDALIILIHHSGKDQSKGSRGWSGLKAAADIEIEVTGLDNPHKATITKQKNDARGMEWGFNLFPYTIGIDEDGDEISSCIYEFTELSTRFQAERKLGGWQGVVMKAFNDALKHESNSFVLVDVLIELSVQNSAPPPKNERDTRRQHIRRAITTLCTNGTVRIDGDKVIKNK